MSQSRRRIAVAALLLCALGAALAWLNVLWVIPLAAAALLLGFVTRRYRLSPIGKILSFLVLLAVVPALYYLGVLPVPLEPDTSTGVRLPWLGRVAESEVVRTAASRLPPDPIKARLDRFDTEVFNPDIDSVLFLRLAASWFNSADRFTRALQETRPDLSGLRELEDALNELRPRIQSLDHARLDQFTTELASYRNQLYALTDAARLETAMREFEEWYLRNSLGDIQLLRGRLRNALDGVIADAARQALEVAPAYVATLEEDNGTWQLDEQIRLRTPLATVRRVDVGPLLRMTRPGAPTPQVLLSYEETCRNTETMTQAAFDVDPVGAICITLRTVIDASVQTLDNRLRLASFKGTKLAWPAASPGKIFVTLDLEREAIPLRYPLAVDITRQEPLTEIRVPRYSYFSSSLPVSLAEVSSEWDVIRPAAPTGIRDLAAVGYHWIELLPDHWLFRRRTVQSSRNYLFPENIVMLLATAAAGAAFGLLFPDSKKN